MEFNFSVQQLLNLPSSADIAILHGDQLKARSIQVTHLSQVIDQMGQKSAIAQGLPHPITSLGKVAANGHTIYIKADGNKCIGILKVGLKKLFVRNRTGAYIEMNPLSVLDFYVHESVQRGGQGKQLFEKMLKNEGEEPRKLAYDRPSPKLKGFLAKHYNLRDFVTQNNNFVVYDDYFIEKSSMSELGNKTMNLPFQKFSLPTQQSHTISNFNSVQSSNLTSGSGQGEKRVFSNLGRELLLNKLGSGKWQSSLGTQGFSTISFEGHKGPHMLSSSSNSTQISPSYPSDTSLNNHLIQGYSPFKVFQHKQQASYISGPDQEFQQSQQSRMMQSKHQSLPPKYSQTQNSNQYLSSFYDQIQMQQNVNTMAQRAEGWHKIGQNPPPHLNQNSQSYDAQKMRFNHGSMYNAFQQHHQPVLLQQIKRF